MKFYESHFEEYLSATSKINLHPKLTKIYDNFPKKFTDLKNIIFFGPNGVGKYSQMLHSIKKYSPTELKYEKKITLLFNKQSYFFKISDIHYEIDMSLLGCNSKLLWHDIYQQFIDIISAKTEKSGIIVCKCFHEIHSELLENFYSYMQQNNTFSLDIKFILITEELSFIPDNILNCCEIVNISRPSKTQYSKCLKKKVHQNLPLENITNTKILHQCKSEFPINHEITCNKIIKNMIHYEAISFLKFRDILYDIFIYNLDIYKCVWYILSSLIIKNKINESNLSEIMIKTYSFFQYYNNNYRPIYHLENYLYSIVKIVHKLE
jgi:DNA polymerase III delta prime subunit